ncbi:hypothetical protein EV714DRAFT_275959 [Schizophyllum commune]
MLPSAREVFLRYVQLLSGFLWSPPPAIAFNTACAGCGNPLCGHGGLPQDMLALLDGLAASPAAPPSTVPPRIPAPSPSVSGPIASIPQPAGIPGRVSSLWQAPSRVSSSGSAPQQRRAGAQRAYHSHSLQPASSSSARPPPRGKAKAAEITIVILVWPVPLVGRFTSGEHCLADINLDLYQFFALYRRLQDHQLVFDVAVLTNQEGNALAHTLAMQIRTHFTSSGYSIIDNPNGDTNEASDLYIVSLPFEPVRAKKSRNSARFETTKYGPNTFDVKAIHHWQDQWPFVGVLGLLVLVDVASADAGSRSSSPALRPPSPRRALPDIVPRAADARAPDASRAPPDTSARPDTSAPRSSAFPRFPVVPSLAVRRASCRAHLHGRTLAFRQTPRRVENLTAGLAVVLRVPGKCRARSRARRQPAESAVMGALSAAASGDVDSTRRGLPSARNVGGRVTRGEGRATRARKDGRASPSGPTRSLDASSGGEGAVVVGCGID